MSSRLESDASKEMLSPAPAERSGRKKELNERQKVKHGSNANLKNAS
jgi:hypothetical protein